MRLCWWQEWKGNLMLIAVFDLSRVMAFWWRFWDEWRWTTMTSNNDNSNKDDEHLERERVRERVSERESERVNMKSPAHGTWRHMALLAGLRPYCWSLSTALLLLFRQGRDETESEKWGSLRFEYSKPWVSNRIAMDLNIPSHPSHGL